VSLTQEVNIQSLLNNKQVVLEKIGYWNDSLARIQKEIDGLMAKQVSPAEAIQCSTYGAILTKNLV
jgi:hypothetical protein